MYCSILIETKFVNYRHLTSRSSPECIKNLIQTQEDNVFDSLPELNVEYCGAAKFRASKESVKNILGIKVSGKNDFRQSQRFIS